MLTDILLVGLVLVFGLVEVLCLRIWFVADVFVGFWTVFDFCACWWFGLLV